MARLRALVVLSCALAGCTNRVSVPAAEVQKLKTLDSGGSWVRLHTVDGDIVDISSYDEVGLVPLGAEEPRWFLYPPVRAVRYDDELWLESPGTRAVRVEPYDVSYAVIEYPDPGRLVIVIVSAVGGALALGALQRSSDHTSDQAPMLLGALAGGLAATWATAP
jgi:hypothetical protein